MTVLDKLKMADFLLSFDKHPCRELSLESKTYYLDGLVLAVWNDGAIAKDEREYLLLLNSSFGFEDDRLEEYIEFAQNADSHSIKEMIQAFDTEDIKYSFMMDCMIIAGKNDNFDEEKKAVIDYYFKIMKITNSKAEDLRYLAQRFQENNAESLGSYFRKDTSVKKLLFEYLIEYYGINLSLKTEREEAVVKSMQQILNVKKAAVPYDEVQDKYDILKRIKCIKYDETNAVVCNDTKMIPLFVCYRSLNRKKPISVELGDLTGSGNQIFIKDVYGTDSPKDIRRGFHGNLKKYTIFNSLVISRSLKKNQIDYFLIYVYDICDTITGYINTKETKDASRRIYEVIDKANLMDKLLESVKKS